MQLGVVLIGNPLHSLNKRMNEIICREEGGGNGRGFYTYRIVLKFCDWKRCRRVFLNLAKQMIYSSMT